MMDDVLLGGGRFLFAREDQEQNTTGDPAGQWEIPGSNILRLNEVERDADGDKPGKQHSEVEAFGGRRVEQVGSVSLAVEIPIKEDDRSHGG